MENTIGINIKKYRLDNKLSQDDLANLIFTTKSTISKWESGAQVPQIDSLKLLSSVFKTPIYKILGEKPIGPRERTWEIFGKSVFYVFFWGQLDWYFGVSLVLVSLVSIIVGLLGPIVKVVPIIAIDLHRGIWDYLETLKVIGYFLAFPLISAIFIGFGVAMLYFARSYFKISNKVFWNNKIKFLDTKWKFPKFPKWVWIIVGISTMLGTILLFTVLGIEVSDGKLAGRMW